MAGIAIAIAFFVARAAGETELTREYLDLAFDVVGTEQEAAVAFSSMIENVEDFNRAAMISLLEQLEEDTADLVDRLDEADPPTSLQKGHGFLLIATTAWRSALSDARSGLIALTEDVLDEDGMATLTRGLVELRVGDRAYVGFLSELSEVDTELQGGDPPLVAFVPSAQEGLFDAQKLAKRLYLTTDLGPVQSVAVADIRLDPASVGRQRGFPVLAATPAQSAEVTIANRGNIPVVEVRVQLSLVGNDGTLWQAEQEIDRLEGGELTTLVFSELPVVPGTTYDITATSLFDDDEDEDDTSSIRFVVNAEG